MDSATSDKCYLMALYRTPENYSDKYFFLSHMETKLFEKYNPNTIHCNEKINGGCVTYTLTKFQYISKELYEDFHLESDCMGALIDEIERHINEKNALVESLKPIPNLHV
jgi:hypothetical protein